jgi:hypothetical protein
MPTISTFFGIIIRLYYRDHSPPHFHAYYQEHEALIAIEGMTVMAGSLPRRASELVFDWLELHKDELLEDWRLAQERLPLNAIPPLE